MLAELTHHLGCERHEPQGTNSANPRNGRPKKTLKGESGNLPVDVPRDANATFEPQIAPKGQTRFEGFDDKILSLYAGVLTTRQIQQHLEEVYQVEVWPSPISSVTDAVIDEVRAWQASPVEAVYPILYLDCLMAKIRDGAHALNKAVYLAIGINPQGVEAIEAVFPRAGVQLCAAHLVRQSLNYVGHKQRKGVAGDLRLVQGAATREEAGLRVEEFALRWGCRYPTISPIWGRSRERVVRFLAYPEEIRRVTYTTNAIEPVNTGLRKIIKSRGSFPTEEGVVKVLYLGLQNISQEWAMAIKNWEAALNRFAIVFGGRLPIV